MCPWYTVCFACEGTRSSTYRTCPDTKQLPRALQCPPQKFSNRPRPALIVNQLDLSSFNMAIPHAVCCNRSVAWDISRATTYSPPPPLLKNTRLLILVVWCSTRSRGLASAADAETLRLRSWWFTLVLSRWWFVPSIRWCMQTPSRGLASATRRCGGEPFMARTVPFILVTVEMVSADAEIGVGPLHGDVGNNDTGGCLENCVVVAGPKPYNSARSRAGP